jgi:DNA-binding transcriptional LysR family regulator
MMNFRLQVFRRVAEAQSITKAARILHLSQPAVTKHIQLLEETLGVPLFVRAAKGMLLTQAGVVYLQHVQDVAAAHEEVARRLQAPAGILTGRLRLGCNRTVLSYYLPEKLAAFKKRYPSVTCEIADGNTDTIVGALLDQRIDLALIEGPCQRPEVQKKTFLEDEIIWIASPSDPLLETKRLTVPIVLRRALIIREVGAGSRQFMETHLRRLGIRANGLNIIQEIPNPEAIKRLVMAGLGISYVFRFGVEQELASGKLVKIDCPKLNIRRPFSLLFPQGPTPSGIVQSFIQLLLEKG